MTALGVLCCFALFVCLTLLASFFLPSHLSFKNMYICVCSFFTPIPEFQSGHPITNTYFYFFPVHTAGVWSCPATTGEKPPPCSHFTFTAIDDRRAVLFGGENGEQQGRRMNDVYIIDLLTMVQCFFYKARL